MSKPKARQSKLKAKQDTFAVERAPMFSPRFIVSLVLMVGGIAWMAYYYAVPRVGDDGVAGNPAFMADLGDWNYLIGFGALFLGLMISAHPSTPLGRGRGVVVGMLGCFLIGLVWICTFYIFSNDLSSIPVFDDLGQKNLFVGIGFMAVGFAFATRWE
ncbi:cell division protein CrgA [Nocardioides ferulae]|uniref:cell division protein CrgA n=1 Tax=Nocardioides ferulae TaxID=2340821 RepID=UPI001F0BDBB6|nr:cell division protein CrgA [Nocardioides ferulae]